MYQYCAFGLGISSEVELPELLEANEYGVQMDVKIELGSIIRKETEQWFYGDDSNFYLWINDIVAFHIIDGKKIVIDPKTQDEGHIRLYLLGSAFGALLLQRGSLPLHGSALAIDGKAVVFSGRSGIGKSTLAHAFVKGGFPLLSDDVVAVDMLEGGVSIVHPAYPQQKLWYQSLEMYKIEGEGLQRIREGEEKYILPVKDVFLPESMKFAALVQLDVNDAVDECIIEELKGVNKLQAVMNETYRHFFAIEMGLQAYHFQLSSSIANLIRVIKVTRPSSGCAPDYLKNRILAYLQS